MNRIGKVGRKAIAANKKQNMDIVEDIRNAELDDDVQIGRVIKTTGFGQCRVFYLDKGVPCIVVATIRGKFGRGGARKAVPIQTGSIVVLLDSRLSGTSRYQIISMLDQSNLTAIRSFRKIDSRLLDVTLLDESTIMKVRTTVEDDDGYEFAEDVDDTIDFQTKNEERERKSKKEVEIDIDTI
jgi:hypothetical protein